VRWIALRWGIDLCYRGIDGMRDILERLKLERRITVIIIAAYVILALALNGIRERVPEEDRRYLDPVPRVLKPVWPLARFFGYYVGESVSVEYLEWVRLRLKRSDLAYMMGPQQFVGIQCVSAIAWAVPVAWLFADTWLDIGVYGALAAVGGAAFPFIKVTDRRKRREKQILRDLPVYLDFVTMAVEAGMNINGALRQAVEKGPVGPFQAELHGVLRDINAGMGRIDALRGMAERLEIREINSLVSALAQAEHTGGSVANALRIQAEQRRVERFQRAEKKALEAPVKLVFPLVTFIFPTTFIILGFPIAMKFLHEM